MHPKFDTFGHGFFLQGSQMAAPDGNTGNPGTKSSSFYRGFVDPSHQNEQYHTVLLFIYYTRSSGALRAPTSNMRPLGLLWPFGPPLGPSGLLLALWIF